MAARRTLSRIIASALALTLLFGTVPALAADGAVVTANVTVSGVVLTGMTADEARAAIAAACATPTLAPVPLLVNGVAGSLAATGAVVLAVGVDAMTDSAMEAVSDLTLTPSWTVDPSAIDAFVVGLAAGVDCKPKSATRKIVKHRLRIVPDVVGLTLDRPAAGELLTSAVVEEIAAGGSVQPTITIPVTERAAKKTADELGKTILVVLHERRVYLYKKNGKLEKKYRCAIGMRAYPTPKGVFKVIAKKKKPTWRNPYSAWSKSMPAFIKGGYYNPLGLRALYINASGIRIHGTSKTWSMGQAASHGCIRLTNKNVVDIYPRVPVGTPVYILS